MILDQAKTVTELVRRKKRLHIDSENLGAYQTRRQNINTLKEDLIKVLEQQRLFSKHGIGKVDTNVTQVVVSINMVLRKFQEDAEWIKQPDALKDTRSAVTKYIADSKAEFAKLWSEHRTDMVSQFISHDLLNVLQNFSGYSQQVARIKHHQQILSSKIMTVPENDADFLQIEQIRGQIEQAWNNMEVHDLPSDVQSFLMTAASSGGASLQSLTPSVMEWLQEHQLTSSFRISFSSKLGRREGSWN